MFGPPSGSVLLRYCRTRSASPLSFARDSGGMNHLIEWKRGSRKPNTNQFTSSKGAFVPRPLVCGSLRLFDSG